MRYLVASIFSAVLAGSSYAQTGTFAGTVARDTVGNVLAQVQVELPGLDRTTLTNASGAFEFSNIPAGRVAFLVRAIGYQLLIDTVEIAPAQRLDADVVLTPLPITLDTSRTVAKAAEKRLPFGLDEMEGRRKMHMGGYFVTDSMLKANDEKKLTYFMAQIPNLHEVLAKVGTGIFLANARGGPGMAQSDGIFPSQQCYVDVFIDGSKYFQGPAVPGNPPPDFNSFWAKEYAGVEYYPGGATVPAEYNGTASGCGVLLLWTRHGP
ncbi:MAG TPA: carboxypeptidase-like regulatory domain-containing protein [Gemmatimonadaceae bacterium]|jgi:hypothetical protein